MKAPEAPPNEEARLAALSEYAVLDTPADPSFDALTQLAAEMLGVPIALVSIVDADKQWFKSRYGLEAPETPRDVSFCGHVVAGDQALVVPDAWTDARFADNPLVLGEPRVRFYAGMPLRTPGGFVMGTLCVIDHEPREMSPRQLEVLRLLARQVVDLLELRRNEKLLASERATLAKTRQALLEKETELGSSTDRLRALFDGMSEGVVLQDRDGAITATNLAACRILGLSDDQLKGRSSVDPRWKCVHPDGSPFPSETHPAMVALRTRLAARNVLMGVHKPSGQLTWISINVEPLGGDASTAVITTFRDITEQKASEAERDQLRLRLARQERLATTGTLAAGVGHEINNPLTYVSANLEFALEELRMVGGGSPSGRIQELVAMLSDARDGAERIRKIVRGLRSFAREDSPPAPTEVGPCIEQSINMAMHELRQKAGVHRELLPVPLVLADEPRLSQVLVNLLVNAAQAFTTNDSTMNRVVLSTRLRPDDRVEIAITDNGPGIRADVLPRIFDPFFTTKRLGEGTGLGLAISHSIVTSFGGELVCETKHGEGTTFRLLLARADLAIDPTPDPSRASDKRRGRVLVVDDEEAVLRSIARLLQVDHEVIAMTDGREALAAIERSEHFDVVFCDLMMPHLSGLELYERVRAGAPALADRFVFIWGGIIDDKMQAFLSEIPNERLEKPFSPQNLRGIARRFVGS